MSLIKPRLEWGDYLFTGTLSSGSPIISSISSTAFLVEGQYVSGTGIPANAKILSKTSSTVTLDKNATANGGQSLTSFYRFDFAYPYEKDSREILKPNQKTTESLSGKVQTQVNFIEATRKIDFSFLTDAEIIILKSFFETWALLGNEFRYFENALLGSSITYSLDKFEFSAPQRAIKGAGFLYSLSAQFRRAISL